MQFNAAKLQKQSCFIKLLQSSFLWSSFKKQRSATQRSAARRMLRLKAQRSAAYVWTHLHANAAQRSAAHHMLRLKATCIYSAAQRMCERTLKELTHSRSLILSWHMLTYLPTVLSCLLIFALVSRCRIVLEYWIENRLVIYYLRILSISNCN